MHYGARFYSPRLGRFIQPDTIVPEPGNPQALNRYAYVNNNPLRYTDPTGHQGGDDYWLRVFRPGCPPLPPQPPGTTWDTGLRYWIKPGGLYGEGEVYWNVGRYEVGPVSVYVPPANSQGFNWPAHEEGWKQIGGDYIGISDTTKRGVGPFWANVAASYAVAHSQDIPSTMAMVPQRINANPKYIGQDQPIYVPGQYEMGGLGSGSQLEAAVSLPAAIMPGENISLRYVSITIEQKGELCRALVIAHYLTEAYISYREETPWYKETPIRHPPPSVLPTIGQDWRSTSLGRRW